MRISTSERPVRGLLPCAVIGLLAAATPSGAQVVFDFETGAQGFTSGNVATSVSWQVTTNRGLDPGHSSSSSFYFGEPGPFDYDTGFREAATLDSPSITLGQGSQTLTFNYFLDTEQSVGKDIAEVQISDDGGFSFTPLLDNQGVLGGLADSVSGWQTAVVDISAFAGETVIIRFEFDSVDAAANMFEGWYVDDVKIGSGTAQNPADFETGDQGFTAVGGAGSLTWQRTTNRGADAGHSPSTSFYFGDPLVSNYDTGTRESANLDWPSITLGKGTQTLRFNHFLQTEGVPGRDRALVLVSDNGGASFTPLLDNQGLAGGLVDGSGSWETAVADISAYAGSTIIVRFSFDSVDAANNDFEGWYVDDVEIVSGPSPFDFESGPQGFTATAVAGTLTWQRTQNRGTDPGHTSFESFYFGDPSVRHYDTGVREAATLDSPPILLGSGPQSLSFNYFLETEQAVGRDIAEVLVSTDGGSVFNPVLSNQSATLLDGTGQWQTASVDLSALAGMTVIIRFSFDTVDGINNDFEGWYVDDLAIVGATQVTLASFEAHAGAGGAIVEWETAGEAGTVGFHLQRLDPEGGDWVPVNSELLPALLHAPQGGRYRLVDEGAAPGTRSYRLVEVEAGGSTNSYGPFAVSVERRGSERPAEPMRSAYEREARAPRPELARRLAARRGGRDRSGRSWPQGGRRGSAVKIEVTEPGLYYVDATTLSEPMDLPPAAVTRLIVANRLSLSLRGEAVAWLPARRGAGLYFYGVGGDSIYAAESVYWLRIGDGLRMESLFGGGPPAPGGTLAFTDEKHYEEQHLPGTILPLDPDSDFWFWDYLVAGSARDGKRAFTLSAPGLASGASGEARITVHLQGATRSGVADEHRALVTVNGASLGEAAWTGFESHTASFSFDPRRLRDGRNTVEVEARRGSGAPLSVYYVDSFELRYPREYRAQGGSLFFRGDGNELVALRGFEEPEITLLELGDPLRPKLIAGVTAQPGREGYGLSFHPASPDALHLAVASRAVLAPRSVRADRPSSLRASRNRADYLVLTPGELAEAAAELARHRESQGLSTMVVELEDVMDEFNHGQVSPLAIRDFLAHAYRRWRRPPRYAVLAGAGTFDYRDHQGIGDNRVPALMVTTPLGLFPADNRFGDVVGDDGIPEIAIGRIPILDAEELQAYVDKLAAYERSAGADWTSRVLFVADRPDGAGDFPADSERLLAALPAGYRAQRIYLSETPVDEARALLLDSLREGAGFVSYIGHAGLDRLSQRGLLTLGDVSDLQNEGRTPVIAGLTCQLNLFAFPGVETLGEALVSEPKGGAAAVWASAGLSLNVQARVLGALFQRRAFARHGGLLGDVVRESIEEFVASGGSKSTVELYTLLGDPAIELARPY